MDRIVQLQIFRQVADRRSFSAAADAMGLPRSSVSAAIRLLEDRIGVRLFDRTTRRVAATPEGVIFYERCQRLLADLDETEGLFRREPASLTGRLRLSAPPRIARRLLVPALPSFFERHPGLWLDLDATDRSVDMVAESVDCAIRVGERLAAGAEKRLIGELAIANVASPDYLARHGVPVTPDDIARHAVVKYASPTTGRSESWEWVENGELRSHPAPGPLAVNNGESLIAACIAGLGLVQVVAFDVADDIAAGSLVEVMPEYRAAPMSMALVVPEHRAASRRVAALIEWLTPLLVAAVSKGAANAAATDPNASVRSRAMPSS